MSAFIDAALKILGDVPPNRQNLELLDQYRGKLVPFVGAGLSAVFGYPQWKPFLEIAADRLGLHAEVDGLLENDDLEGAAEVLAHDPGFDDTLRMVFDPGKLPSPLRKGAVRHLPAIAQECVLTTNFDRVLEKAFEPSGLEVFLGSETREVARSIQSGNRALIKLHGDCEHSTGRVLTSDQYADAYGSPDVSTIDPNRALPKVLEQVFGARALLFLGCSLQKDRTTRVIAWIAGRLGGGPVHFALMSASENTEARRKQLGEWSIRPLFFPAGQYDRVDAFLACLAEAQPARSPQPAALPASTGEPAAGGEAPAAAGRQGVAPCVERIEDAIKQKDDLWSAFQLLQSRMPEGELYDIDELCELIRHHLAGEFGPHRPSVYWKAYVLVAKCAAEVVGFLLAYDDLEANYSFISYLVAKKPQRGATNATDVSVSLLDEWLRIRRGVTTLPARILTEVDHPAKTADAREQKRRLARIKLFAAATEARSELALRCLDLDYVQPKLDPEKPEKRLLLLYGAETLSRELSRSDASGLLTWLYTRLYSEDIFDDAAVGEGYGKYLHELLKQEIDALPERVRLLRPRELCAPASFAA